MSRHRGKSQSSPAVVLVATQRSHWGACRFPSALRRGGFFVVILARPRSLIALGRDRIRDRFVLLRSRRLVPVMRADLEHAIQGLSDLRIVPTDDGAHHLLARLLRDDTDRSAPLSPTLRSALDRSLGAADNVAMRTDKTAIQALAQRTGVDVPAGGPVESEDEALRLGAGLGYPVLLKLPRGAGGGGIALCEDAASLTAAYRRLVPDAKTPQGAIRRFMERLVLSDTPGTPSVQKFIAGETGISCAYAEEGRTLAVMTALVIAQRGPTRPATAVRLVRHPAMEEATARMVAGLGASGFLSFDFVIEPGTGRALLLECNPRPIQMMPLGPRIGADLIGAMRAGRSGRLEGPADPLDVALFPQEWGRDPQSPLLVHGIHDVPWDEPLLLAAMMKRAERHHRSLVSEGLAGPAEEPPVAPASWPALDTPSQAARVAEP
ncbi:hypothetical protein [Prosthecomicrobium pneumaticum]|uniref:ATP-grasp domain-containing protein n=1 Tax=Prosthecomicrobium pneumaticum TaxID=81895 RepID=A0A7W9CTM7_9HYPH|nr:hypothetical protein [Prosthecomicrobium pneumaticum]MBB5751202.1 hypothetical protein [Prosthecomicrobium pneumaticum]